MANEDFREGVREVIKKHNIDSDELRALAADLETLADKWDDTAEIL